MFESSIATWPRLPKSDHKCTLVTLPPSFDARLVQASLLNLLAPHPAFDRSPTPSGAMISLDNSKRVRSCSAGLGVNFQDLRGKLK
jgi:hypothetical protein